ncbi:MAG: hypothetical protein HZB18_05510 [Chloroflexi bacterium]|nr:hypothetical protein [Chloroflexota bacterium]
MDVDPDSFDPELRFARLYAIASTALGLISLCIGVIPICSGVTSVLGVVLGIVSLKTEDSRTAKAGIFISALGIFTTFIYVVILVYFRD